jgi:proteic killer suppression protein
VIRSFKDDGTKDIFDGKDSKAARKQVRQDVWTVARRKLDQLNAVKHYSELRMPPQNKLHPLGDGRWAFRVNDKYRVVFRWEDGGAEDVTILDYH